MANIEIDEDRLKELYEMAYLCINTLETIFESNPLLRMLFELDEDDIRVEKLALEVEYLDTFRERIEDQFN